VLSGSTWPIWDHALAIVEAIREHELPRNVIRQATDHAEILQLPVACTNTARERPAGLVPEHINSYTWIPYQADTRMGTEGQELRAAAWGTEE
jgi:hypothetical protein